MPEGRNDMVKADTTAGHSPMVSFQKSLTTAREWGGPLVLGVTAVLSQVVLLRETAASFHGNELSFGIFLGSWLFWSSLGTLLGGRLLDRFHSGLPVCVVLLNVVSWLVPLTLVLARSSRVLWGLRTGEVASLTQIMALSFLILAPLCLVLGAVFPSVVRLMGNLRRKTRSTGGSDEAVSWVNRVYIRETLGFIIGGLLFNYVLVAAVGPWFVISLVSVLNVTSAWWLLIGVGERRFSRALIALLVCSSLLCLALVGLTGTGHLEQWTQSIRWQDFTLVKTRESQYGTLTVTAHEKQKSFFENGILVATVPAPSTNEPFFHLPLLLHPAPRHVLVVGGGIAGGLREVLKHPVESLDYVCLDPQLVRLVMEFVPEVDRQAVEDKRVTCYFEDGCRHIRRSSQLPAERRKRYDLVFLALPDPSTAFINRGYSMEFFTAVKQVLEPDGILILELSFSETYVGTEMRKLNGSIYRTLRQVFPTVQPVPEYTMLWMASPSKGTLVLDSNAATRRYLQRGIQTEYLETAMVQHKLDRFRIADRLNFLLSGVDRLFVSPDPLAEALSAWDNDDSIPLNRDFHPVSYYLQLLLSTSAFSRKAGALLAVFARTRLWHIVCFLMAIFTILAVVIAVRKRSSETIVVPVVLLSNGLTAMIIEVLLLFGFQVVTGYVFGQVAFIITLFMAGLAVGSAFSNRVLVARQKPRIFLLSIETVLAVFSVVLFPVLVWCSRLTGPWTGVMVKGLFALLILAAGVLDGLEFPLGSALLAGKIQKPGSLAGTAYGADLAGSFLGALLVASFCLPVLGLAGTCLVLCALKCGSILLLTVSLWKKKREE